MDNIKKELNKVISSELRKYKLNYIMHKFDSLINVELLDVSKKYKNDIKQAGNEFDKIIADIDCIKNIKLDIPEYKYINKKAISISFVLVILFFGLWLCFDIELFLVSSIVLLFANIIWLYVSFDMRNKYVCDSIDYEKKIRNYVQKHCKLLNVRDCLLENNSLKIKCKRYDDLIRYSELFDYKYSFLMRYQNDINNNIMNVILDLDNSLLDFYKDFNVDNRYRNYLSMFKFYQYIKDDKCDNIDDAGKLFKKDYAFILKASDYTFNSLNDNSLIEGVGNSFINKIDKFFEELKNCVILDDKSYDDVCELLNRLNDAMNIGNKIEFESEKLMSDDFIDGDDDEKKINIVLGILDNNKDSNIDGLKYYGISDDGKIMVLDDVRLYVVDKLRLPKDKFSNQKFPCVMAKRMINDVQNELRKYVKVALKISDIYKCLLKTYKIKDHKRVVSINTNILIDTIELLGNDIQCYIFDEKEPVYMCNNNGEIAIIMANLEK